GTSAAGDAGGRERRLRRNRRSRRRSADYSRKNPESTRGESCRETGPVRAKRISRDRLAGSAPGPTAMGGRRRKSDERTAPHIERSNPARRGGAVMMRLPYFRYAAPRTVGEASEMLAAAGSNAMLVAGGTDLLPNMKRRQQVPSTLIGLRHISELRDIRIGDGVTIGTGVTLATLVREGRIRAAYPALWQAAGQVATPQLRNMGTLGGNLCLDTRCNYYDQNYEWRKAIDFCMKKDGAICWVAT